MNTSRTNDMSLVRSIVTHPQVYPWVTDDGGAPADGYQPVPPNGDAVLYVLVESGGGQGIFAFYQQNTITTEAHTCVLPSMWGRTHVAARAAIDWVFANTRYQRIVTSVPDDNPLAARLAAMAGMQKYGHNPGSFLRKGRLLGVDLFGVSKEESCQLEQ